MQNKKLGAAVKVELGFVNVTSPSLLSSFRLDAPTNGTSGRASHRAVRCEDRTAKTFSPRAPRAQDIPFKDDFLVYTKHIFSQARRFLLGSRFSIGAVHGSVVRNKKPERKRELDRWVHCRQRAGVVADSEPKGPLRSEAFAASAREILGALVHQASCEVGHLSSSQQLKQAT